MLTYTLDKNKGISLYECLYRNIKNDILDGKLKAGDKLPSKRTLAQHLKVSIITVENAYSQLIDEGYVYAIQKKGYYVGKVAGFMPAVKKPNLPDDQPASPEYFMDFKKNSIISEHFPFTVWAKIMREVILEQDKRLLEPLQYNGVFELRRAIADYLYHFRGMAVDPKQIIVGSGTEYLYNLIVQLLGREKVYAAENPGHTKIAKIYQVNGIGCEYIDIDKDGLSAGGLRKTCADVVHISPAHHYPTGIVMSAGRRQELLHWASEKTGRYVIEDDYDSEFRFAGRPIQTMFSIDHHEKVIYINTFSKTIAPSIRISYMVLPGHLLEKFRKKLDFYACTVPGFEQYTLAKFISQGSFERHINRMKKLYRQKRDTVISAIQSSPFSAKVTINEEKAGLHFLMKVDTPLSDQELKAGAAREGICLACMSDYLHTADRKYNNILVMNYSGIDTGRLPEALRRLARVLG